MLIDCIFIVLLVLALFKGWKNGLVMAVFSVLGLIIALVAAIKLSAVTADYLKDSTNIGSRWLPFLSFAIVFFVMALLVRLAASLISKTMEMVALGWINRLAGVILYAVIYTIILSVLLFYIQKINLVNESTIKASHFYSFIEPWGPMAINGIGKILPWFRDMFAQLEVFFDTLAQKAGKL